MKMKSDKIPFDRKTPLSNQAKALLDTAPRFPNDEKGFVFPNINKGNLSAFSRDSVRALLKRMHVKQRKVDGIGWAKDARGYGHKAFPRDLRESCLDHRNESYQCAYDREQALGDMRDVYEAWGNFCTSLLQVSYY